MIDLPSTELNADDIIDEADTHSARMSRRADRFLSETEGRTFGPTTSVRQAVGEDIAEGRQWARVRSDRARAAIVDEPIKATLYALGIGVLIGLLLRR